MIISKEYKDYHGTPAARAARSKRVLVRRIMEKELGAKAIAGKDIDHKTKLKNGGTNARSNLRVRSVKSNRGDNR